MRVLLLFVWAGCARCATGPDPSCEDASATIAALRAELELTKSKLQACEVKTDGRRLGSEANEGGANFVINSQGVVNIYPGGVLNIGDAGSSATGGGAGASEDDGTSATQLLPLRLKPLSHDAQSAAPWVAQVGPVSPVPLLHVHSFSKQLEPLM